MSSGGQFAFIKCRVFSINQLKGNLHTSEAGYLKDEGMKVLTVFIYFSTDRLELIT